MRLTSLTSTSMSTFPPERRCGAHNVGISTAIFNTTWCASHWATAQQCSWPFVNFVCHTLLLNHAIEYSAGGLACTPSTAQTSAPELRPRGLSTDEPGGFIQFLRNRFFFFLRFLSPMNKLMPRKGTLQHAWLFFKATPSPNKVSLVYISPQPHRYSLHDTCLHGGCLFLI